MQGDINGLEIIGKGKINNVMTERKDEKWLNVLLRRSA